MNIDAIAAAVLTYAYSTESVNGVVGEKVPGGLTLPEPAGPERTVDAGGGGLAPDHDHEPTTSTESTRSESGAGVPIGTPALR